MRPSLALDLKRSAVRDTVSRFRVTNPRIFGSVLRGTDLDGSDLDLLVDSLPETWAVYKSNWSHCWASMLTC